MGVVVPFRRGPRDGTLVRAKPAGALALEAGCDWGWCDRPGVAWRWAEKLGAWLVVCRRCASSPPREKPMR